MSRMPCNIEDGPDYEESAELYDPYEAREPERNFPFPEPEFERDTSLVDTLKAIARVRTQTDILDDLYTGLCEGMYKRRQG